jgi:spore maturation protein CgeB
MSPNNDPPKTYCIGFLGADWWGSDARAVAMEFRRQGHIVIERNYEDFFPTRWTDNLRILRRLAKPWMAANFNHAIEDLLQIDSLDFLLVFKGMLLSKNTLRKFCAKSIRTYCLYPDVSVTAHGKNIAECIPLYDCVFTTKRFHLRDEQLKSISRILKFVHHGYDPDVHRPIPSLANAGNFYSSDVSFVGAWSPKKEGLIQALVPVGKYHSIKIWGPGWDRSASDVRRFWQGRGAYGDELAAIYCASKINLGLLSEKAADTAQGDSTTVRTWQIPACGAFLLHELTDELKDYFIPDHEVGVFNGKDDLANKVIHYLSFPAEAAKIATAGRLRCITNRYDYSSAVSAILSHHESYSSA